MTEPIGAKLINQEPEPKFRFDHTKLVVGATFYESGYGMLLTFKVTQAPVIKRDKNVQLEWYGEQVGGDGDGRLVHFLTTLGYEHYGPKIYLEDEIAEINGRLFTNR